MEEEVTSPSQQVYASSAEAPGALQAPEAPDPSIASSPPNAHEKVTSEYPPDPDPSVEISMTSVPDEEAIVPVPEVRRDTPVPPPPPASLADPRIGETLVGRYRLDRLVGKGGMGRVYLATQFPLNRPVAVKILNPEFQRKDPQFVRRFFLEAASAARLTHPNTITVFDYGEAESGELFIAMEYLNGRPLSRVIASEGPFEPERALHVAMQICRALREAHTKGIIHRDLKPGNILLLEEGDDADFVKVLDFGLVKLFHADGRAVSGLGEPLTPDPSEGELTKAGMFLGSPKYMSPEQIQGRPLDPRTDIYSLGVLMYQMLTGKPPFFGGTSVEVIYKHVNEAVPPFRSLGIEAPMELEHLVMGALVKRREERYESMSAFLARMKDCRRLITGISASMETGIDIRLSDLRASHATGTPTAYDSTSGMPRPQTRPHLPAHGEAAFSEHSIAATTEDTGSHVLMGKSGRSTKMAMVAPILAGTALLMVLGVLGYVLMRDGSKGTTPPPSVVDDPVDPIPQRGPMARVRFTSEPSGAEVFEHGISLGKTPLVLSFSRDAADAEPHEFLFKIPGRGEAVERVRLDKKDVEIAVRIAETATPPPPGGNGDEDYKENPY
ncbi:MAG: serine/threonine-protein kinase [Deltaproteobacteria bacterium]